MPICYYGKNDLESIAPPWATYTRNEILNMVENIPREPSPFYCPVFVKVIACAVVYLRMKGDACQNLDVDGKITHVLHVISTLCASFSLLVLFHLCCFFHFFLTLRLSISHYHSLPPPLSLSLSIFLLLFLLHHSFFVSPPSWTLTALHICSLPFSSAVLRY